MSVGDWTGGSSVPPWWNPPRGPGKVSPPSKKSGCCSLGVAVRGLLTTLAVGSVLIAIAVVALAAGVVLLVGVL